MGLKEKGKIIKSFTPIFSVVLVAACVTGSLKNYEAPVYAAQEPETVEVTETEEVTETKGSFDLEDGIYNGTGTGYAGEIKVAVEIKEGNIVAIDILNTSDDAAFFNRAKVVIDRIIEKQTLDVDTVSGATFSSKGIISAVKNALTGEKDDGQTQTKVNGKKTLARVKDASSYQDGTYYGTGIGFGGKMKVQVDIADGKIISIQILEHKDGSSYISKASALIQTIIATQSTNVDTVSGATYSSNGIIEAVRDALRQAAGEEEDTSTAVGNFELDDGVYYGEGTGYGGTTKVSVQIQGKQIVAIDVLSNADDRGFFERAKTLIDRIIKEQTYELDTVSGATYSSRGILSAVKNALTGEKDSGVTGKTLSGGAGTAVSGSSATIGSVADASGYKDGTYYGTGTGFGGALKVQVDIVEGKINSIRILESRDTDSYLAQASSVMDAIIKKQSTNVDTVSGASYSSVGIIQAVRDALSQAATDGSENKKDDAANDAVTGTIPYNEGIYYGSAEGYSGDVTVAVVIQDHTIKAILVTDASDDESFFGRAMDVVKQVVKKQSTEVDTVSGATYSSNGLLNAIKNALEKAEKVTNGESIEEKPDVSALETAIGQAEQLQAAEYTETTWAVLQVRLEDAKEALGYTDQKMIDRAAEKLNLAIALLEKKDSGNSGEEDNSVYIDGTYNVTVPCQPDEDEDFEAYNISMNVTIHSDKIVAVTDITGDGDASNNTYVNRAANGTSSKEGMVSKIIRNGLPEGIDTVSGATCSSNSIIEGCKKALEQAKRPEKTENE